MKKGPESATRAQLCAEILCVGFMALVVAAANGLQIFYILFPELGAIAGDVLARPHGKWARQPWKLVATPTITGVIGVSIGRYVPYGVPGILAAMTASIAVIYLLRSAVVPAISAAALPIVLGITSWRYPLCILGTLLSITVLLLIWKRTPYGRLLAPDRGTDRRATEVLERVPKPGVWLLAVYGFVTLAGLAAQVSGWRFILFPPLIVIAFEMLGHPKTCPWAKAPLTFPIVCALAATVGAFAAIQFGATPWAAVAVLAVSLAMLRVARLRMPPVLAIGLIPFILPAPSYRYALSVAIGTSALTCWYLAYIAAVAAFARRRLAKSHAVNPLQK